MNYKEFKHKAKELGCEIKETDKKIKLYYWETGSVFTVSKLLEKSVELPSWIATYSQHDILDLVLEFSKVPLSDRRMDTEAESKPQKKEFKMRYKEFKEEVENLGYEVVEKPTFVEVQKNGYTVTSISTAINMMIDTYYVYFTELEERERTKLLELAFELAKTPIKEREDEKVKRYKFRLKRYKFRHKYLGGRNSNYLKYDNVGGNWILGHDIKTYDFKGEFTIDELKEKFNSNLDDWEIIEVEEDEI